MSAVMQSSSEPLLLRSDDSGVTTLTLNRPGQFNSLSDGLIDELQAALEAVASACQGSVKNRLGGGNV